MKNAQSAVSLSELEKLSDKKLISRIKRGNRRAFDVLIKHHKKWMRPEIHSLLRNHTDETEVYQLFLIGVWNILRKGKYHDHGLLRHWLGKVMRSFVDQYRRSKKRFAELDEEQAEKMVLCAQDKGIQQFVEDFDLQVLQRGMKEDERIAVNMKIIDNLPDKEIIKRLQKPKGTVLSLIHRGRESLRKQLQPYYLSRRTKKHKLVKLSPEERKKLSTSANDEVDVHTWRLKSGKWMLM